MGRQRGDQFWTGRDSSRGRGAGDESKDGDPGAARTGGEKSTGKPGEGVLTGAGSGERAGDASRAVERQPGLVEAIETIVNPATRGDPTRPLKWTSKSLISRINSWVRGFPTGVFDQGRNEGGVSVGIHYLARRSIRPRPAPFPAPLGCALLPAPLPLWPSPVPAPLFLAPSSVAAVRAAPRALGILFPGVRVSA